VGPLRAALIGTLRIVDSSVGCQTSNLTSMPVDPHTTVFLYQDEWFLYYRWGRDAGGEAAELTASRVSGQRRLVVL